MGSLGYYELIFSFDLLNLSYMESTTFYRIQIDQPNVFLFISENGSYKSGSKRVTVQLRTAVVTHVGRMYWLYDEPPPKDIFYIIRDIILLRFALFVFFFN